MGRNQMPRDEQAVGSAAAVYPSYRALLPAGELSVRAAELVESLQACELCPRRCGTNRTAGEKGKCGVGRWALVSSWFPHHGEEFCLRGYRGSGTIFFAGCNLKCVFCQNYELSWDLAGEALGPDGLARAMLDLQRRGCHNINLVTPSHVVAQIVEALAIAAGQGLQIPIVYNTSGYDTVETLRRLEGVVDIYMPDLKFGDSRVAARYTAVADYWEVATAAVREMHRQVGDLELNGEGLARRGLLVRHLILPGGLAGSERVLRFLAEEISPNTAVNLMTQYYPAAHAFHYPELSRRISGGEYLAARRLADRLGLRRLEDMG